MTKTTLTAMQLAVIISHDERPRDVEYVTLQTECDAMGEHCVSDGIEVIGPMTPADDPSYLYRLTWRATQNGVHAWELPYIEAVDSFAHPSRR